MPLQFRPLRASDLASACRLWSEADGVELAEGDSIEELTRYLERNRLVGAVLAGHDGRRGYVYHLAVEPNYRGQGIGQALMQQVQATLKAAGIRRALLLVAADNAIGQSFWSKQGWETLEFARPMGRDL
jgi:N-acetylglutamate synthase